MKRKRMSEGTSISPLGLMLLQDFAAGKLSATKVQAFAHAATKSGPSHQVGWLSYFMCFFGIGNIAYGSGSQSHDLDVLAAVGAYGNSDQNCHRDLMKQFFHDLRAPSPTMVECPVYVRDLTTGERKIA